MIAESGTDLIRVFAKPSLGERAVLFVLGFLL